MDGADGVYPPSEDTYLLVDALLKDRPFIASHAPPHPICIEVGSGSGEVSKSISSLFDEDHSPYFALSTDVNPLAALQTKEKLSSTNSAHDTILSDLFNAFHKESQLKFDIIIFNPPYVPTEQGELDRALSTRDISASWAGGPGAGRHVIDAFLLSLASVTNINCEKVPTLDDKFITPIIYLVLLEANGPENVAKFAAEKCGLTHSEIILKRKAGIETLYIMRFTCSELPAQKEK